MVSHLSQQQSTSTSISTQNMQLITRDLHRSIQQGILQKQNEQSNTENWEKERPLWEEKLGFLPLNLQQEIETRQQQEVRVPFGFSSSGF